MISKATRSTQVKSQYSGQRKLSWIFRERRENNLEIPTFTPVFRQPCLDASQSTVLQSCGYN